MPYLAPSEIVGSIANVLANQSVLGTSWSVSGVTDTVQALGTATTTLATLAAGWWAYRRFFRSGLHAKIQLNVRICGDVFELAGRRYLVASAEVANAGLTRVDIDREGSQVSLWSCRSPDEPSEPAVELVPKRLMTFTVLDEHGFVEPGETLHEQRIVALSLPNCVAVMLQARVASGRIAFTTTSIVPMAKASPLAAKTIGEGHAG
jgi:hypothetical protein